MIVAKMVRYGVRQKQAISVPILFCLYRSSSYLNFGCGILLDDGANLTKPTILRARWRMRKGDSVNRHFAEGVLLQRANFVRFSE
jgi:hypothetical protein